MSDTGKRKGPSRVKSELELLFDDLECTEGREFTVNFRKNKLELRWENPTRLFIIEWVRNEETDDRYSVIEVGKNKKWFAFTPYQAYHLVLGHIDDWKSESDSDDDIPFPDSDDDIPFKAPDFRLEPSPQQIFEFLRFLVANTKEGRIDCTINGERTDISWNNKNGDE